jgi:hypothetical protein
LRHFGVKPLGDGIHRVVIAAKGREPLSDRLRHMMNTALPRLRYGTRFQQKW